MDHKSKTMLIIKMVPVLKYLWPEINTAYYWINKKTSEEYVRIQLSKMQSFDICVTADSPEAATLDVLRGIGGKLS